LPQTVIAFAATSTASMSSEHNSRPGRRCRRAPRARHRRGDDATPAHRRRARPKGRAAW
jgi:hypothetical protein